jgi:outer membrane lipoprotein
MSLRRCLALLPCLAALACARPPTALRGEFADTNVAQAAAGAGAGQQVRWGGELVSTTPRGDETCFEVVERPLDRAARPRSSDESSGRFVACSAGLYDPALWAPGRQVTIVGRLDGAQAGTVGEATYRFPRVAVEAVHLWPVRDPHERSWPAIGIGIGGGSGGGVGGGIGIGF